jgi:hypothetical protein
VAYLKDLDPTGRSEVGWYPFLWQGRGKHAKRVRGQDYALLPDGWKRDSLVEEREAVDCILTRAELTGQRADEHLCSGVVFQVDRDLRVFCGAACDSAGIAGAVPELREQFALGKLSDEGFMPLLEAYLRKPPRGIELLGQVTWGELAARYGDRTNDEIYHLFDLPQHKWAAAYLLETVGTTR